MAETNSTSLTARARTLDYLIGRNSLIGLASVMLLIISGYASWSGMTDFIIGVSSSTATHIRELPGGLSSELLVIAVVVTLTFLMWLALRETFGAQRRPAERLITFLLYLFLATWSVGFGYGFWWSLIAGEEATKVGLSGLKEDARDAVAAVAARLDAVHAQLDNVVGWSDSQMAREEASGGSCGTASGAGRGKLYNARRGVRDSISSLRDNIARSWIAPVQADLDQLQQVVANLDGTTIEARQKQFETTASEIRGKARSIAARSDELGKSTAGEMRVLADTVSVPPGRPDFSCYDPTLAERLREAANQADEPVALKLREAAFSEGPAGVANAIKRLWENIGYYLSSFITRALSIDHDAGQHAASGQAISGRDMIALLATLGVDLGLLALTMLNPPAGAPVRRDGLAATQAQLHLPSTTVIRHLRNAFETAIARAPGASLDWVRRHFIHHGGASYFVIPNLYSVDQANQEEELRALAVNQLAGVLDDLKLVRALSPWELKRLGKEEMRDSYSDLDQFRGQRETMRGQAERPASFWRSGAVRSATAGSNEKAEPNEKSGTVHMRNHGLLSKAQRALDIAGWSAAAQKDVEVFRLAETKGFTPLLTVLNETTIEKAIPQIEPITQDAPPLSAPAEPAASEVAHKEHDAIERDKRLQIAYKRDA